MKKIFSFLIIAIGIVLDQWFKNWIVTTIPENGVRRFIPGIISLTHLTNDGAAWSMLEGKQWLFFILTPIVIIVALCVLVKKGKQNWYFIALSLVISGALGNFIDRIRLGYVVDMFQLDFVNFPIFNVADSLLTVGFACLFIAILVDKDGN